ncbi:hypothetical protein [Mycobacterium sp. OTB74]|jgi:hypothetical protein|uniref:hypothetical protein n=1 Tax=Mycobacterium sp. OTB74 TaxID=1853452 RepID=UPI0024737214|nr:hypothetical protein [Mycobacterium sp. OTB74]MDH6244914.1 uncharacterized membrane protein YcjF (UPF0283 family) [Mycobacterium sp. OTB74]
MPGLASLALGAAPIAGGALLGVAAGGLRPGDMRSAIKADMDMLDRLPPEQTERRAELQRVIDLRIDELIAGIDRGRQFRAFAANYAANGRGGWRDIFLFFLAIVFTVVWWNVKHSRADWLPMFILLIVMVVISGLLAVRGIWRAMIPLRLRKAKQTADDTQ